MFHTECIDPWLQQNKKCPLCRVDMDKNGLMAGIPGSSQAAGLAAAAAAAADAVVMNATAYAQATATSSTHC
jgi:hypothetical protein